MLRTRDPTCYHTGSFILSHGIVRNIVRDRPYCHTESFVLSHGIVCIITRDHSHGHTGPFLPEHGNVCLFRRDRSQYHTGGIVTRDHSYHSMGSFTPGIRDRLCYRTGSFALSDVIVRVVTRDRCTRIFTQDCPYCRTRSFARNCHTGSFVSPQGTVHNITRNRSYYHTRPFV